MALGGLSLVQKVIRTESQFAALGTSCPWHLILNVFWLSFEPWGFLPSVSQLYSKD